MDENFEIPPTASSTPLIPKIEKGSALSDTPPPTDKNKHRKDKKKTPSTEDEPHHPDDDPSGLYTEKGKLRPKPKGKYIDLNAG